MHSTLSPSRSTRLAHGVRARPRFGRTGALAGAVALAALATTTTTAPAGASARSAAATSSTSLVGICPNPVKIATDWTPEAEQGAYYDLAASGGTIDKSAKTYTAALIDPFNGQPTGVKVELLAGGPALGFQQTPVVLNTQTSILMGADDLDTAIADSASAPVVGIVAPLNNSLHIFLWNPAKYHFKSFADIKKSGVTVLYFKGTEFVEYMAGAGYISESQLDGSYTGTPARFVASGGGVVEQGFATAEPFIYTHETPQWDKAIAYELTSNSGYNPYSEMGEATPANIRKYSACFAKLVPMIQQGEINFITHPQRVDAIIVALNKAFNEIGGNYDARVANYAVKTLLADKIVWQTPGEPFASFDLGRVRQLISQLRPVLKKTGKTLPSTFSPSAVMTNRFIDKSIKFTGYSGPYNNTKGVITVSGIK
jgi:hypothetical protein